MTKRTLKQKKVVFYKQLLRQSNTSKVYLAHCLSGFRYQKLIFKSGPTAKHETAIIFSLSDFAGDSIPVPVYELCDDSQLSYHYLPGLSLHQLYPKLWATNRHQRLFFFTHILNAVKTLHEAPSPIIHNDLTPGNIIIKGRQIKIIDFADAQPKSACHNLSRGKPHYASPEQKLGKTTNETSDIYQLGCILFELIFEQQYQDRSDTPQFDLQQLREQQPELSRYINIIEGCLTSDPELRFQSTNDCVHAIDSL